MNVPCRSCGGAGRVKQYGKGRPLQTCRTCKGDGFIPEVLGGSPDVPLSSDEVRIPGMFIKPDLPLDDPYGEESE
jgi:DnaJ-class molecular chaperone